MPAKIFYIILAFSVFFSTTGIFLGKHLCKQKMQAVEILSKTKNCCKANSTCGSEEGSCEKDCCSHEYEYFQSDQEKLTQSIDFPSLNKPAILAVLCLVLEIKVPSIDNNTLLYKSYRPPIVERDISVLFQTFLI